MNKFKLTIGITIASLFQVNTIYAADENWAIGLAASNYNGPYYDSKTRVAPIIMYEKNRLSVSSLEGVSYRLLNLKSDGNLSLLFTPRIKPKFGDNVIYDNLDRKNGLDIGLTGKVQIGLTTFEFGGLFDVTNAHNGFEIYNKLTYQFQSLPIEFSVGAVYKNVDLNQYLFGVNPSETNDVRIEYTAEDSLTGFVSVSASVPLTKKIISFAEIKHEDMGSLSDSPLVKEYRFTQFTLGVIYQWQ